MCRLDEKIYLTGLTERLQIIRGQLMLAAIVGFYCVKSFLGIDKISKAIAAIKCPQLLNMPISFSSMPLHFTEQFN